MNPAFDKLNEEKRNTIIDVCLEEFAEKGYEKASTNVIVNKAGISKGLLFHYFGSKKKLYLYLLDMTMQHFYDRMLKLQGKPKEDLFERIIQSGMIKVQLAYEAPLMYKLIMEAFIDTPIGMEEDIQVRYQKMYKQSMPGVFENIDYTKFRDDIDKSKAIEFMSLCLDALYGKYVKMAKGKATKLSIEETKAMIKEQYEFVDMLKYGIYKS